MLKRNSTQKDPNKLDTTAVAERGLSWSTYKSTRNEVNISLRISKGNYFKSEIRNNSNDYKNMWKCLRSLIPKSRVALPNTLHLNGQSYQDDILISNVFNDYLIKINSNNLEHNDVNSIIDTDPVKINVNNQQNKSADSSKVFEFGQVDCDLVKKIILNLDISKSSGVDDISAKLIKHAGNEVINTLTELVNLSLNQGKFPYKWKHAKIFPLFKIGDFNSMTTYRPISILPVVSKVMERIVHKQLYDYLVNNNVLSEAQFGFRPCHSTASALGALTESWLRSIDEGLIIGALFIDLRRAFDTVDSSILLIKLQKLGMSNNALSWFKSYQSVCWVSNVETHTPFCRKRNTEITV